MFEDKPGLTFSEPVLTFDDPATTGKLAVDYSEVRAQLFKPESVGFEVLEDSGVKLDAFDHPSVSAPTTRLTVEEMRAAIHQPNPNPIAVKTSVPAEASPDQIPGNQISLKPWMLVALITWASIATLLVIFLWMTRSADPGDLDSLPDDGIVTSSKSMIDPRAPLTPNAVIPLGKTSVIGMLEVTPISIEQRNLTILPNKTHSNPALALKVRFKNISADRSFSPLDPKFLYPDRKRRLKSEPAFDRRGVTYSYLQSDQNEDDLFFCYDLAYNDGERIEGQSFDKLAPGETVEAIIASETHLLSEVKGTMTWRIKIRKGKTSKGVGVASVIGVPFSETDVAVKGT